MAFVVHPRFHPDGANDQPEGVGSLFRDIAARTPGVDYHPPTGQLGSYGRGPLGEPTFEPFHHTYVDWLVKRTQEDGGASSPRSLSTDDLRMERPPVSAESQARAWNDLSAVASRERSSWGGTVDLDRSKLIDVADRRSGPSNAWPLNPLEGVKVRSFRGFVNKPTRENID